MMELESEGSGREGLSFLKSYQVRDGTGQGSQPGTQFFQPWVGSQGSQSEAGVAMGFYQDLWSQQQSGFHYMLLLFSDAQSCLTLCDPMERPEKEQGGEKKEESEGEVGPSIHVPGLWGSLDS